MEVPRESRVQIVGHVVGIDLDVSRCMDEYQPEISAARETPNYLARYVFREKKLSEQHTYVTLELGALSKGNVHIWQQSIKVASHARLT